MLKKTVQYVDYNDQPTEETLYFNLSKMDLVDLIELEPRIKAWADKVSGPERELNTEEVLELLSILKILVDLSYGERSEDGKHFYKDSDRVRNFKHSAAYDAMMMSFFEDPESAFNFMINIVPKDLRDKVTEAVPNVPGKDEAKVVELPAQPAEKKFEDYTEEELLNMPQDEFQRLIPRNPREMTKDQLAIAFQRKSRVES